MKPAHVLLTGASGYVGGRLLPLLLEKGYRVRCLARNPEYLLKRVSKEVEVVQGDLLEPESVQSAMVGIDVAFYLVHSLAAQKNFREIELSSARHFALAAVRNRVRRIVYLSGLGHGRHLSPHLKSRQEVGDILRASGVPTFELRAGIIIGSGSLSFEMIRSLVRKLPVMITPRWTRIRTQPIAVEDVLSYLLHAAEIPVDKSGVFEIGSPDQVAYADLMKEFARQRNLKRWMLPVPVLTPWLSGLWLGLVTPLYAQVGQKLIEGLKNETVVKDTRALDVFPVRPMSVAQAIHRAMVNEDEAWARTRWSDALSAMGDRKIADPARLRSRIVDTRSVFVRVPPATAFQPIRTIGGESGWYYGNFLWRIRGFLDRLAGGPGLRRGRRDAENVRPGDTLDFWRVEEYTPDQLLRLKAEMKVPGRAWLQFEVTPERDGSRIHQTALFDPAGLSGLGYWYLLYPAHAMVFRGMLWEIAREAKKRGHRTNS